MIKFFKWLEEKSPELYSLWIMYIHKYHKIELEDVALGKVGECSQVNSYGYKCKVCGDVFMTLPDSDVIEEIDKGNKTYSETFKWLENEKQD